MVRLEMEYFLKVLLWQENTIVEIIQVWGGKCGIQIDTKDKETYFYLKLNIFVISNKLILDIIIFKK